MAVQPAGAGRWCASTPGKGAPGPSGRATAVSLRTARRPSAEVVTTAHPCPRQPTGRSRSQRAGRTRSRSLNPAESPPAPRTAAGRTVTVNLVEVSDGRRIDESREREPVGPRRARARTADPVQDGLHRPVRAAVSSSMAPPKLTRKCPGAGAMGTHSPATARFQARPPRCRGPSRIRCPCAVHTQLTPFGPVVTRGEPLRPASRGPRPR